MDMTLSIANIKSYFLKYENKNNPFVKINKPYETFFEKKYNASISPYIVINYFFLQNYCETIHVDIYLCGKSDQRENSTSIKLKGVPRSHAATQVQDTLSYDWLDKVDNNIIINNITVTTQNFSIENINVTLWFKTMVSGYNQHISFILPNKHCADFINIIHTKYPDTQIKFYCFCEKIISKLTIYELYLHNPTIGDIKNNNITKLRIYNCSLKGIISAPSLISLNYQNDLRRTSYQDVGKILSMCPSIYKLTISDSTSLWYISQIIKNNNQITSLCISCDTYGEYSFYEQLNLANIIENNTDLIQLKLKGKPKKYSFKLEKIQENFQNVIVKNGILSNESIIIFLDSNCDLTCDIPTVYESPNICWDFLIEKYKNNIKLANIINLFVFYNTECSGKISLCLRSNANNIKNNHKKYVLETFQKHIELKDICIESKIYISIKILHQLDLYSL